MAALDDISFVGTHGLQITLVKQKATRLRSNPPRRLLHADTADHPVAVLRAYIARQRARLAPPASVFSSPSRRRPPSLNQTVADVARRLDTGNHWTAHCLRVGAIPAAHRIGVSIITIMAIAGHAKVSTTMGYVRHDVPADAASRSLFGQDLPGGATSGTFSLGVFG